MILGFSTQLNGKPTYFPEKIVTGLEHNKIISFDEAEHLFDAKILHHKSKKGVITNTRIKLDGTINHRPKLHTIREDKNDRWEAGTKIDFFINVRKKDMFRFAPVLPVVSTQEIFMTKKGNEIEITVAKVGSYMGGDDTYLYHKAKEELARNDGFDNYEEFKQYFFDRIEENWKRYGSNWFKGKIIHWTDLKY
jgi:hypothetical protein